MKWKPYGQSRKEIITFVYPKPDRLKWRAISTAFSRYVDEEEEWETLTADAQKGEVEGIKLELLGFDPLKGEVTSKTFVPIKASKECKDSIIFDMHFDEILKEWGSNIRCVAGWKENIIVCSPQIPKIGEKLRGKEFWKFREEVIDSFEKILKEKAK